MMDAQKHTLIYLTGFMGSGKSTIAPILANTLGYRHFDIDEEIERTTGKSVTNLFASRGELFFRETERFVLTTVSQKSGYVISLGGGTIASEENLRIIKSTGLLVYLKADLPHILRRLKNKTDRPLLQGQDGSLLTDSELQQRVEQLLSLREPFYRQADITIITGDRRVGPTVDDIVRTIRPFIT